MTGSSWGRPLARPVHRASRVERGPGEPEFVAVDDWLQPGSGQGALHGVFGGPMSTEAMFSEPGEYVLRVRANDASGVSGAGHSQCCWTNGFVKVTVTR